jgi:hypothetical protein
MRRLFGVLLLTTGVACGSNGPAGDEPNVPAPAPPASLVVASGALAGATYRVDAHLGAGLNQQPLTGTTYTISPAILQVAPAVE